MSSNPYSSPAAHLKQRKQSSPSSTEKTLDESRATTSMVLGFVGVVAWLIPLIGFVVTIPGLIKGIQSRRSGRKGHAVTGIVLNSIFLLLTIANSVLAPLMMM